MATNVNVEKLNDPEIIEKLKDIEDPQEFRAAAEAEGIDLDDALKAMADELPDDAGELGEDDLENVAGGISASFWLTAATTIAKGVLCLKKNMRRDGSMRRCDCGLHGYAVRK